MLNVRIITIMPKKLTTEEWVAKARAVHGDRYDYSKVEYINGKTKVCIICPEHGEFWQTPQFSRERVWGFMYETQKAYPSKTNPSRFLYVDFYIPSLNTVIEYNGEQHYRKVGIWEERFEKQQARDEELRQYCKDNGIKLIEIRYDEDVWEVLNEKTA